MRSVVQLGHHLASLPLPPCSTTLPSGPIVQMDVICRLISSRRCQAIHGIVGCATGLSSEGPSLMNRREPLAREMRATRPGASPGTGTCGRAVRRSPAAVRP